MELFKKRRVNEDSLVPGCRVDSVRNEVVCDNTIINPDTGQETTLPKGRQMRIKVRPDGDLTMLDTGGAPISTVKMVTKFLKKDMGVGK